MKPVLVAHGTRKAPGVAMIGELAERVGALLGIPVHTAFVDVLGPSPADVLRALPAAEPAVVVPAFLCTGYHVRTDIPAHVAASGHRRVVVTQALGPSTAMTRVLVDRLRESHWRPTDTVLLAAAGSSDPAAQRDLRIAAAMLSAALGSRVELGYAATGEPAVADAVAAVRGRVAVASYLLADGLFQDRLRDAGADVVSAPLGTHPDVVRLIASRFRRALVSAAA